jgi:tryptophan synthase alpha chain
MGGDPDVHSSARVVDAVIRGGANIVEVGIPFSDPIADGKSIQAADVRSLAAGTTPGRVLEMIRGVKASHPSTPVVAMTYYNILYSNGVESFLDSAKASGVDGIIVPDLPLDEVADYATMARARGLDTILLAAPTTPPARMRAILKHTTGFLYLVSVTGVTGARTEVQAGTIELVGAAKRLAADARVPLGVGFGISTPEQVREVVAAGADAVIVGSGIVDRVAEFDRGGSAVALVKVNEYVRVMKAATKKAA